MFCIGDCVFVKPFCKTGYVIYIKDDLYIVVFSEKTFACSYEFSASELDCVKNIFTFKTMGIQRSK